MKNTLLCRSLLALLSLLPPAVWIDAQAGPLRDRIMERRAERHHEGADDIDEDDAGIAAALPKDVKMVRDLAYGSDKLQRIDVYLPKEAHDAPVILMVHGGGWYRGDKTMKSVVENKVAHWVPKGFVFVSVNYRMIPDADPLEQAKDVARALAFAQGKAATWGADPRKFVLMGHSAGAHLAGLVTASPSIAAQSGATSWLGTVTLDSAALDVEQVMNMRHMPLYDRAFGDDRNFWKAASPLAALQSKTPPVLAVCSSRRHIACPDARHFIGKVKSFGAAGSVVEKDMSHKEINDLLGKDGDYTRAVDAFLAGLDSSVAGRLR